MKITRIDVPKGINFMNEWVSLETNPFEFPNHPHIIDKGITGCGFTHMCLTNLENLILCSPRKMLLQNKKDQLGDSVFYVINEYDKSLEIDKDLTSQDITHVKSSIITKPSSVTVNEADIINHHVNLKQQIVNYILDCHTTFKPCKILVTYDSFRIVKEALKDLGKLSYFRVVIDEFQSIFTDARFKSGTEMEFLYHLSNIEKVCFVSATPMIDEYLEEMDNFNTLPYYKLDWASCDPGRVTRPTLEVNPTSRSINIPAKDIINTYLRKNFEIATDPLTGKEIISDEAVFYVNSVKNIYEIIRGSRLKPDQVNILCANTPENQEKLNKGLRTLKLGNYNIGTIPLKGEKHKMFTFCTRTVYLGADFYSDCARSYIFSDANIDSLAVDITLDLPQIMGRQRLITNPWKDRAVLYVKLLSEGNKLTQEQFEERLRKKEYNTKILLEYYLTGSTDISKREVLARKYLKDAKHSNYKDDYVAVNQHKNSGLQPEFNKLVMLAERRAFDIQQVDFKDRFAVKSTVSINFNIINCERVETFMEEFNKDKLFSRRMKLLCEKIPKLTETEVKSIFREVPVEYYRYYTTLGPEKLKALGHVSTYVKREYEKRNFKKREDNVNLLDELFYNEFKEGDRISSADLKKRIKSIYENANCPNTPRAIDIKDYFETKEAKLTVDGKRCAAFDLIKKLR